MSLHTLQCFENGCNERKSFYAGSTRLLEARDDMVDGWIEDGWVIQSADDYNSLTYGSIADVVVYGQCPTHSQKAGD